ncbi:MAG: hypothetical protein GY861_23520 [bacterium]|nr:hypothetical protein [bacterium]
MNVVSGSELKVIGVKLQKIKVSSFSARDCSVVLDISFDDGIKKQIFKDARVDEPEELAKKILSDIISMEENIHSEFDGEKIYTDAAIIIQDSGSVEAGMKTFFDTLHGNIEKLKSAKIADGYMDLVRNVTKMELIL